MIRIALDSNVLVYGAGLARGAGDLPKIEIIKHLNRRLRREAQCFVSTQALGETFNVALKSGQDRVTASEIVRQYSVLFAQVAPSVEDFTDAVELATRHQLQIWDSLILSCASKSRCTYLLSEDMQDGFVWRGVTVLNPLGPRTERLLFG